MDVSSTKTTHKLNELASTAISGNDISSSCLYVSALAIAAAGQYAWVSLLVVAGVLFLFRKIYGEVVGALPLNGGAYNALLNTASKNVASLAACLTILSYMATAVISAGEAMHYAGSIFHTFPETSVLHDFPVFPATIVLLGLFMILNIIGIGESARVATVIFLIHLASLCLLVVICVFFIFRNGTDMLTANFQHPINGSVVNALVLGFAAAMLGISGFESSANFVEEQEKGVFPKTLKNMWVIVSIFNPAIAFLALSVISIPEAIAHSNALLSHLGHVAGGNWLLWVISIDATLVLSGAVLTSYVGVSGLVQRMTLDRCLPQFLLKLNKKGVPYRIMIAFFLLCVSVLFITEGNIAALAGVYLVSFLSVMLLFGLGNILLKIKRGRLPRPEKATPLALFVALGAVLLALYVNIDIHPKYFAVFLNYFIPTVALVAIVLYRIPILKAILGILDVISLPFEKYINRRVKRMIVRINSQQFVFFTKGDDIANLNRVMIYMRQNENTKRIKIVTVVENKEDVLQSLQTDVAVLDRAYPEIDIEFIIIEGQFTASLVEKLSTKWKIPKNFMFIGSPSHRFPYRVEELGGVRLII